MMTVHTSLEIYLVVDSLDARKLSSKLNVGSIIIITIAQVQVLLLLYLKSCTNLSENSSNLKTFIKPLTVSEIKLVSNPLRLANKFKLCLTVKNSGK